MRLLLDTHVLIWMHGEPDRIAPQALRETRNPANELFVSAVTPYEIANKARIGKLPEAEQILPAWDDYMRQLGGGDLVVSGRHSLLAGSISTDHRDPFDRILAAQSMSEGLTLVTSDRIFDAIAGVRVLWD